MLRAFVRSLSAQGSHLEAPEAGRFQTGPPCGGSGFGEAPARVVVTFRRAASGRSSRVAFLDVVDLPFRDAGAGPPPVRQ